ncbi:dnaJ homolog subfamily C member 27-B-like [Amphiura filiformis]|uniref:dnaJ homolog subfamily C member 27-B-like n=1 Tax=Amphiura filiformis TaxID=82378 RepID=UPI003B213DEC
MDREPGHLPVCIQDTLSNLIWMKVVAIGNTGAGKTCIIKNFCEDKFVSGYQPTVGVDYGFKIHTIKDTMDLRVHLWDMSGHTEYLEVRNELYQDSHVCLLVYDVTNKHSFERLEYWIREAARCGGNNAVIAVVANKIDLKAKRIVSPDDGLRWAASKKVKYYETSAYTGEGIQRMLSELLEEALTHKPLPSEVGLV